MKKPYQIESQRAVKRLEEMAANGNRRCRWSCVGRDGGLATLMNVFSRPTRFT